MDDDQRPESRSRDDSYHTYDLSDAVYGSFPSPADNVSTSSSVQRSRANLPTKPTRKRKSPSGTDSPSPLSIKLAQSTVNWLPNHARTLQIHQMDLHQSTCLNLNVGSTDSTESDLWILPDFDEWEADAETSDQPLKQRYGDWGPLLRRAAKSNLERLKARLEGDGWDFVGGKYGEYEKALQEATSQGEESVDEEFDVVVLPVVQVSC